MVAVSILALVPAASGCGSSHRPPASAGAPDTIIIRSFDFAPSTLVVAPGATITVRNDDTTTHTVTASGAGQKFDTGHIDPGASATFTAPTTPGSYPYICQIHQFMQGTLQVR